MDIEPAKPVVNGRMWQPGQSGNPNGRLLGSRTVFSQGFLKDLAEVWALHGKRTMISTAQTNPGQGPNARLPSRIAPPLPALHLM
jgi:hypothetical protein